MNWKRFWHVFRAYTANQEPDPVRHEWVADMEAMAYFDEVMALYSDNLYKTAARVAREEHSLDRHGNPLITLDVAAKAHKRVDSCACDAVREFASNLTSDY